MARIMAEKEMETETQVMVDISAELSIVEEAVDADAGEELPAAASDKMLVLLRIIPDHIFNFCTKKYNSKSSKL